MGRIEKESVKKPNNNKKRNLIIIAIGSDNGPFLWAFFLQSCFGCVGAMSEIKKKKIDTPASLSKMCRCWKRVRH